jgi:antidote-toxin recognition MazE-like antitoxin
MYKGEEDREEVVFERDAALIALNRSFVVTIPIAFVRANNLRAGDRVILRYDEAGVHVSKRARRR